MNIIENSRHLVRKYEKGNEKETNGEVNEIKSR
jgi:hypothetical protein